MTTSDLQVLESLYRALENALLTVTASPDSVIANYQYRSAIHINNMVEGYIFLKKSGLDGAAKQLVRPMLDTEMRMLAVHHSPEYIVKMAYAEFNEDLKWAKALSSDPHVLDQVETDFSRLKVEFLDLVKAEFPDATSPEVAPTASGKGLFKHGTPQIADTGKVLWKYNFHYRLYCRQSHGNMSSIYGLYNDAYTDIEEVTIFSCIRTALDLLRQTGAEVPDFESLVGNAVKHFGSSDPSFPVSRLLPASDPECV